MISNLQPFLHSSKIHTYIYENVCLSRNLPVKKQNKKKHNSTSSFKKRMRKMGVSSLDLRFFDIYQEEIWHQQSFLKYSDEVSKVKLVLNLLVKHLHCKVKIYQVQVELCIQLQLCSWEFPPKMPLHYTHTMPVTAICHILQ